MFGYHHSRRLAGLLQEQLMNLSIIIQTFDYSLDLGVNMNTVKPDTQPSLIISLLNFLGVSLLSAAGVSVVLAGIVLLLSSAN